MSQIDPNKFRSVLNSYPTGIAVVTSTSADGAILGMVVGTFTSVSLSPTLVGFLPMKSSGTWKEIEKAGTFCINILAKDQKDVCAKIASRKHDKFAGVSLKISKNNLPIISDSKIFIECKTHSICDAGDHWFVIGEVVDLHEQRDSPPLLFYKKDYHEIAIA